MQGTRQLMATIHPLQLPGIRRRIGVEPRVVLEVLAGGITRSPQHTAGKTGREPGYASRFPCVVRIRDDRRPEDATKEAELLEMALLTKQVRRDTP